MMRSSKIYVVVVAIIMVVAGFAGGYYYGLNLSREAVTNEQIKWQTDLQKKLDASKIFRIGVDDLGISLDPAYCWAGDTQQFILTSVYDTLIRFRGYDVGTFYPNLADSWEISSDGIYYTFHLHQGVEFASGNEVTADSVYYTMWRFLKLNLGPGWILRQCLNVNDTESVKVLDRYTVQFKLFTRFPPFMVIMAQMNGGIMDPAEVEKHGGQLSEEAQTYFNEHSGLAGSGPYILDHWTREVECVLKRNPNYWGGPDNRQPWFDEIRYYMVKESVDQKLMLEKGDLDLAYTTTPEMWTDWQKNPNPKINLYPLEPARYYYMGMNSKDADSPFRDLKVRQAVKVAINRTAFLELANGFGHLQGGPIVYGYPGYDEELLKGPYSSVGDINKAKQLLSESKYPNGFDTEMLVSEGTESEQRAALVKSQLSKIGINVELRIYAGATALKMFRTADYKGFALFTWGIDYPDPQNLADIHMTVGGAVNRRVAYTPEIHSSLLQTDALCKQAMQTENPAERAALYKQAQWIDHEYGPWVYFYGITYMRPRSALIQGGFPISPIYGWEILNLWKETDWSS